MLSKNIYMPYFYIIRHKETGKQYAGSRWAANCHPDEFMKQNGYTTSSVIINFIIEEQGLDSFEIVDLITLDEINIPFGTDSIHTYESWFLVANNCAKSDDWYNNHNNFGMAFGTESFYVRAKQTFLDIYGVDNPFKSEEIQEKIKETNNKNLGVDYPMQSEIVKQKSIETCLIKYGYEFTAQVPEIREKQTQTRLDKNNGKYYSEESIDKRVDTCLEKYGVENPMQCEEIQNKRRQSCLEIYGVEHTLQSKEIQQKIAMTNLEKYGVENALQSKEIQQKITITNLEKYGVKYQGEVKIECPYGNKVGGKPSMVRWHFENCKLKG